MDCKTRRCIESTVLRTARALTVALALAPATLAQQTWIVDKLNRPGTHFRDLPAAAAAAAAGDVLLVRETTVPSQYYTGPSVLDGKALTVRGEGPSVFVTGLFEVRGLPSGARFVIDNLNFQDGSAGLFSFLFESNAGSIVVTRATVRATTPTLAAGRFVDCVQVIFDHCQVDVADRPWEFVRSRSTVHDSTFVHSSPGSFTMGWFFPGTLDLTDSELWLASSTIRGPSALSSTPPRAYFASNPLYVCRSTVHVGPGTTLEGGLDGTGLRYPAFYNSCFVSNPLPVVHVDPSAQTIGGLGADVTYHHGSLAGLSYTVTPTTLQVDHLYGPAGASLLVLGPLTSTPWSGGGIGPVFVDVANAWSDLRLALLPGPSTRTFAIPPGLPPGLLLGAQALTLVPPGTLLTSNVAAIALP
ncbi:MAG: hypothetical protein AB7O97_14705 [Planctomycetota bacterium]